MRQDGWGWGWFGGAQSPVAVTFFFGLAVWGGWRVGMFWKEGGDGLDCCSSAARASCMPRGERLGADKGQRTWDPRQGMARSSRSKRRYGVHFDSTLWIRSDRTPLGP